MLELLHEIVIQQAVFELIHGAVGLCRHSFKPDPHQQGTGDMITLNAAFATLAALQSRQLFPFPVQLLDLPTEVTHCLRGLRGVSSRIVGHDPIRAAGGRHNPEQLHMMVLGKALDLNPFASLVLVGRPGQCVDPLIGPGAPRIIHLPIGFQGTIVDLLQRFNIQQQVFGRVPRVHQNGPKWELFVMDEVAEHVTHVVKFGFPIALRVVNPVVDQPELISCGMNVDTRDHPNAFDYGTCIAAVLPSHQRNRKRGLLVQHRVVKKYIRIRRSNKRLHNIVPDQAWGQPLSTQIAIDRVVTKAFTVMRKVGERVVDLAHQQILAILQTGDSFTHARYSTKPFREVANLEAPFA